MPFGAGLLDILNQGGQFLAGRQAGQKAKADDAYERQQKAALQQALIEQYHATANNLNAEAQSRLVPKPKTVQEQVDEATGQMAPYEGKPTPAGFDPTGSAVSDAIGHLGFKNVDPNMLFKVAQDRQDKLAAIEATKATKQPVMGSPEWLAAQDALGKIRQKYATPELAVGPDGKTLVVKAPGVQVKQTGAASQSAATLQGLGKIAAESNKALGSDDKLLTSVPAHIPEHTGTGVMGYLEASGARAFTDPKAQSAEINSQNFMNAVVPYVFGKRVTQDMMKRHLDALIPQGGDSPEAVSTKLVRRNAIVQMMNSGQGAGQLGPNGEPDDTNANAIIAQIEAQYPIGASGSAAGGLGSSFQQRFGR